MADSRIPAGKHRYYITLTVENFEWLRHLICDLGKQPRSQVAVVIDEMISEMRESLGPIVDKYEASGEQPSHADFLLMLGKQLQKIGDEQPSLM